MCWRKLQHFVCLLVLSPTSWQIHSHLSREGRMPALWVLEEEMCFPIILLCTINAMLLTEDISQPQQFHHHNIWATQTNEGVYPQSASSLYSWRARTQIFINLPRTERNLSGTAIRGKLVSDQCCYDRTFTPPGVTGILPTLGQISGFGSSPIPVNTPEPHLKGSGYCHPFAFLLRSMMDTAGSDNSGNQGTLPPGNNKKVKMVISHQLCGSHLLIKTETKEA